MSIYGAGSSDPAGFEPSAGRPRPGERSTSPAPGPAPARRRAGSVEPSAVPVRPRVPELRPENGPRKRQIYELAGRACQAAQLGTGRGGPETRESASARLPSAHASPASLHAAHRPLTRCHTQHATLLWGSPRPPGRPRPTRALVSATPGSGDPSYSYPMEGVWFAVRAIQSRAPQGNFSPLSLGRGRPPS